MCMYLVVATVRAEYSTCPGPMHLAFSSLLPPQVVTRNVRVNGSIVLLVNTTQDV